jgi:WD40 repeat protein
VESKWPPLESSLWPLRGELRFWDLEAGKQRLAVGVDKGVAFAVALAPDGRTVAAAGFWGGVRLFEVATGKLRASLPERQGKFVRLVGAAGGRLLASRDQDGTVLLWQLGTGRRATLKGDPGPGGIALAPDGKLLATGGGDPRVTLWETETRSKVVTLRHRTWAAALAFSPDGRTLAAADGRAIRLWDLTGLRKALPAQGRVRPR